MGVSEWLGLVLFVLTWLGLLVSLRPEPQKPIQPSVSHNFGGM